MKKCSFAFIFLLLALPCGAKVITVDDDGPADFNSIQFAIDAADDADTIIVQTGLYDESINFLGKNITLTSTNPANSNIVSATIINEDDGQYPATVTFRGTEDANCALTGFNINGFIHGVDPLVDPNGENHTHATISYCLFQGNRGRCGIVIKDCDGVISNCVVTDNNNMVCIGHYPVIDGCHGLIKNCTIANSRDERGIRVLNGTTTIENCILYNDGVTFGTGATVNISYSNMQGDLYLEGEPCDLNWGSGNIDTDPCFVDPNNGDYHLQSAAGRWDPNTNDWVADANTSDCIDAGNPGCPTGSEPPPDGNRINMGAYGGSPTASKSPDNWRSIADLTNDYRVDFNDLEVFVDYWLESGECIPSNFKRKQSVDFTDFAIFAFNWRWGL